MIASVERDRDTHGPGSWRRKGRSMKEMTPRQRQGLEFMRIFSERHGGPPTVREIGDRFGFTARAAFDHLKALERKGMLERRVTGERASRALVLPDHPSRGRSAP